MANVNSISVSPPAASNTLFGFIGLLIMKLILSTAYVKLVIATNIVNYLQSRDTGRYRAKKYAQKS